MVIAWLVLFAFLIIIELATVALTTIWFAAGALAACLSAAIGANYVIQIAIFVGVSVVLMLLLRPISIKYLKVGREKTNVDQLVGTEAKVTEEINNFAQTGAVYAGGLSWTARSSDGTVIPIDTKVIIQSVSGVKLIVEKMEE